MPISLDLITGIISLLFTLLIFSYVIGDNPLFRVAVYIFVGVSSGYIAAVAVWLVILPRLVYPLKDAIISGEILNPAVALYLGFVSLGALMLLIFPRQTGLARIVLAYLVGVGAAVTLAGALGGTLIPQAQATINAFDMSGIATNVNFFEAVLNGVVILLGAVFTLAYFHFGARQKPDGTIRRFGLIEILAWGGRIFIGIALGAVFAGVYAAALTALIERLSSSINFILGLFGISF